VKLIRWRANVSNPVKFTFSANFWLQEKLLNLIMQINALCLRGRGSQPDYRKKLHRKNILLKILLTFSLTLLAFSALKIAESYYRNRGFRSRYLVVEAVKFKKTATSWTTGAVFFESRVLTHPLLKKLETSLNSDWFRHVNLQRGFNRSSFNNFTDR